MERRTHLIDWLKHARFAGTKTARRNNFVALSFDDGPHPYNTPRVLEVLKQNNIQSTFFWIVENAVNLLHTNPSLFKKIVSEIKVNKHEIGLHAPNNLRPSILSRFFGHYSKQELGNAKETLEEIIETNVFYYRPHYIQVGSAVIYANELGMTTVLGDPLKLVRPDGHPHTQIKTLGQAKPGNIMILHDGEDNSQRKNRILDVLPEGIRLIRTKGLIPTSVSKVLEN